MLCLAENDKCKVAFPCLAYLHVRMTAAVQATEYLHLSLSPSAASLCMHMVQSPLVQPYWGEKKAWTFFSSTNEVS